MADWPMRHWRNGQKYGFPLCCILWFLGPWHVLHRWSWFGDAYGSWSRVPGTGYVPCPLCAIGRRHRGCVYRGPTRRTLFWRWTR